MRSRDHSFITQSFMPFWKNCGQRDLLCFLNQRLKSQPQMDFLVPKLQSWRLVPISWKTRSAAETLSWKVIVTYGAQSTNTTQGAGDWRRELRAPKAASGPQTQGPAPEGEPRSLGKRQALCVPPPTLWEGKSGVERWLLSYSGTKMPTLTGATVSHSEVSQGVERGGRQRSRINSLPVYRCEGGRWGGCIISAEDVLSMSA